MAEESNLPVARSRNSLLVIAAWLLMLLVSDFPDILVNRLGGSMPDGAAWLKIIIPILFLALCFAWKTLRPLWQFGVVLAVFSLLSAATQWFNAQAFWVDQFYKPGVSFQRYFAGSFIVDIFFALVMLAVLWLMKRRRQDFFFAKGDLSAPIGPVRWLGIHSGESWRVFGWIFGGCAMLAVILATFIGSHFSAAAWQRALSLLPFAILFSGINAFTEESYYRLSFLSTLVDVTGKNQALLISSAFFGMSHFLYGSPPGILGFLMTGFLAWLMGKSILETRGMLWAWVIHVMADIFIFFSYALYW